MKKHENVMFHGGRDLKNFSFSITSHPDPIDEKGFKRVCRILLSKLSGRGRERGFHCVARRVSLYWGHD
jgi:hypothetical protein